MNDKLLDRVFASLDQKESRQMVDYLIHTLSTVDYEAAARYFGGFEKMIMAFDVTTGAEYDISEDFVPEPDRAYTEMIKLVEEEGYDPVRKAFLSAEADEKMRLIQLFRRETSASERQIRRFLYLSSASPVFQKTGSADYSGIHHPVFWDQDPLVHDYAMFPGPVLDEYDYSFFPGPEIE